METIVDGARVVPFPAIRKRRERPSGVRSGWSVRRGVLSRGANAVRVRALKQELLDLMSVLESDPGRRARD